MAAPEPDAESIRIRKTREQVEWGRCRDGSCIPPSAPPLDLNIDVCPECKPETANAATVSERDRILADVTRCPIYRLNQNTGGLCGAEHATVHLDLGTISAGAGSTPIAIHPPHQLHQLRSHHRIRGIDEITILSRGASGSEVTARRRANIEASNKSLRRHSEHFRLLPPPPPCRLLRTGPQAGVPIAPTTPCVPGNQRVDYSSPTF